MVVILEHFFFVILQKMNHEYEKTLRSEIYILLVNKKMTVRMYSI